MAPDNKQPDFSFVYVDWSVDCEFSDEDDNEEDEKNTITKNIMWHRDRYLMWITREKCFIQEG